MPSDLSCRVPGEDDSDSNPRGMPGRMQGMMGFMQGSDGEAGTQCPRFLDANGNGVCDRTESRNQPEEDNSHNHD